MQLSFLSLLMMAFSEFAVASQPSAPADRGESDSPTSAPAPGRSDANDRARRDKVDRGLQRMTVAQLVGAEHLKAQEAELDAAIARLRKSAAEVNIYHPLNSYRRLRQLSVELQKLQPAVDDWTTGCRTRMGAVDVTTMGQVVTAPVIMSFIHMRMLDKQQQCADLSNEVNTMKAFALGVFALYISAISLAATMLFGLLPLLKRVVRPKQRLDARLSETPPELNQPLVVETRDSCDPEQRGVTVSALLQPEADTLPEYENHSRSTGAPRHSSLRNPCKVGSRKYTVCEAARRGATVAEVEHELDQNWPGSSAHLRACK